MDIAAPNNAVGSTVEIIGEISVALGYPNTRRRIRGMITAASTLMMELGMEPDDAELVERALGGNADAFGEVVMRFQSRFRVMVARHVASAEDANDIVQDTFILHRGVAWSGQFRPLPSRRTVAAGDLSPSHDQTST